MGLVCPTPLVHSPGRTKSAALIEGERRPTTDGSVLPMQGNTNTAAAKHVPYRFPSNISIAVIPTSQPTSSLLTAHKLTLHPVDSTSPLISSIIHTPPQYELEAYNRNPFTTTQSPLLKATAFGPETLAFNTPYPLYFPRNAGKAFLALRSRLRDVETRYLQEEAQRVPAISAVELHPKGVEGGVVRPVTPAYTAMLQALSPVLVDSAGDKSKGWMRASEVATVLEERPVKISSSGTTGQALPTRSAQSSRKLPGLLFSSKIAVQPRIGWDGTEPVVDARGIIASPLGIRPPAGEAPLPIDREAEPLHDAYGRRSVYWELPASPPALAPAAPKEVSEETTVYSGLLQRFALSPSLTVAHTGAIHDAIMSPSERRVFSAGGDRLVRVWDVADGSLEYSLQGHAREVKCLALSGDEMFLVSGGAEGAVFVWNLFERAVCRALRGHADCVYALAMYPDASVIISASHDKTIKTWHLNPCRPAPPAPPRAVGSTETSILLCWKAPASFNEDITAFHLQYRVGLRNPWMPDPARSLPPTYRSKNIEGLVSYTGYYFRIAAENRMGISEWSEASKQIMTKEGLPAAVGRPVVWDLQQYRVQLYWFAPNPILFGSAGRTFFVHTVLNGEVLHYSITNIFISIECDVMQVLRICFLVVNYIP